MRYKCTQCPRIAFKTQDEYFLHARRYHGLKTQSKPENNSGRPKSEVIKQFEENMKSYIMGSEIAVKQEEVIPAVHKISCTCMNCFVDKFLLMIESVIKDVDFIEKELTTHG